MSKKGFLASMILGVLVTLALSIYTFVSVLTPSKPEVPTPVSVSVAFRGGEEIDVLNGYSEEEGNLSFKLDEGAQNPLTYNKETKKYTANDVNGTVVATVTAKNGAVTEYTVNVYHHNAAGESESEPFVIASKAHLNELNTALNTTGNERVEIKYVSLVSDVDLGGDGWSPIGTRTNAVRGLTFKGNGHTIKNVKIAIDETNYVDYIDNFSVRSGDEQKAYGFMSIGFFGYVRDNTRIENVKFADSKIQISPVVYDRLGTSLGHGNNDGFANLSVGTIVGSMYQSQVVDCEVNGEISGYTYTATNDLVGLGGAVGIMELSQVSGVSVNVKIDNNIARTKNSNIGGIVGFALANNYTVNTALTAEMKNLIENCKSTVEIDANYENVAMIGGLVGRAGNIDIKNSTVEYFKLLDKTAWNKDMYTTEDFTRVGGAVGVIYNYSIGNDYQENAELVKAFYSKVDNVHVNKIDASGLGLNVAGFISFLGSNIAGGVIDAPLTINNSTVKGSISGRVASGFVDVQYPNGVITYSDDFTETAVDVDIAGYMVAGFAFRPNGTITGSTNLTKVVVRATGWGGILNETGAEYLKNARANTFVSGLIGRISKRTADQENTPTVSNFDVTLTAKDSLSFTGVAFEAKDAKLENIKVVSNITSFNYKREAENKNFSTTHIVSGAVGTAHANVEILNVNATINANQGVDTADKYGVNQFGGIVARIDENGVKVDGCVVSGNVYFNYSNQEVQFGTNEVVTVLLAGGLVGSIQSSKNLDADGNEFADDRKFVDGFALMEVNNITLTNNTIKDLNLVIDYKANSMDSDGYRARAVGAIVGFINGKMAAGDVFDLSKNTVTNVVISAHIDTFTCSREVSEGITTETNTLGLVKREVEGKNTYVVEHAYGTSYELNLGHQAFEKDPEDITGITLKQI